MAHVCFYLLSDADDIQNLCCLLAAKHFRQRQRVFLLCDSKAQAEQLDELLWQQPLEAFIPHNLPGEGPVNGAPVQIGWESRQAKNCHVLISLQPDALLNGRYSNIYDFVPLDEKQKQQARERYKQYRIAGHQMMTQATDELKEITNG